MIDGRRRRSIRQHWLAAIAGIAMVVAGGNAVANADYTDEDIALAIETEMYTDPGVNPNSIGLQVHEGIVTLTGTIDNILAKERALKVAETVKGVRSVVNRIRVQPGTVSDRTIRSSVQEALLYDPATEPWELDVEVDEGTVSVSGTVDSWQERELAAQVIKGVHGVTALQNNIEVEYATDRSDVEIRNEIEQRLRWDMLVDDALVEVSVNNGTVTLSGTVGSAAEKRRAGTDAWVTGVRDVSTDPLEVKYWARDEQLRRAKYVARSDAEIQQAIKDAFLYDPRVLSFNVEVVVDNGIATLRGTVDNSKARQAAALDARNTVGVWQVRNHIRVRPPERVDNAIAKDVRDALTRNPYVERYEIAVAVEEGDVTLTGTVDTAFEKAQAEDAASGVMGVVDVKNHLVADATWLHYNPYVGGIYPYAYYNWYAYPTATPSTDLEIEQQIRDQFFWSPFVDGSQITVDVDRGEATLTGTVETWAEYWSAEENAREGGALAVDNDLRIQTDTSEAS